MSATTEIRVLFYFFLIILYGSSCTTKTEYRNGAVPPGEAAATYEVADGFQIELVASEPHVMDPVDMEIDEYGNIYVVEMPGYPLDKENTGRIKILKDSDGDGVIDESILFADQLKFPNGILRYKNGVIVTDVPNVIYLEDADGDGRAEIRDTLLTGFAVSNPHLLVNNPVYGLDNWIYLAHAGLAGSRKYGDIFGDTGDSISFYKKPGSPKLPKNAGSKNVRFKPDQDKLEILSSRSQFGHAFDEWGNHFLTFNSHHIYHEAIKAEYLIRNPSLQVSDATEAISDHGKETEVFSITTNPDPRLSFSPVGFTTSSGGITYYGGGQFPAPYDKGAVFVTESVSNLVHVDKLVPKGATFTARRVEERKEFLASRDFWARPVNLYVGPDGALYMLDYYRRIIEHPEFMAHEDVEKGGLYDGNNMGRIFRVSPKGNSRTGWTKRITLGEMPNHELVSQLSNENQWWRTHSQRLLVDRKDEKTIPLLEKMVTESPSTYGRLHALWVLEGMESLRTDILVGALRDPEEGVRENAVRISEKYLLQSGTVLNGVINMKNDKSAKVRFQALCSLGSVDTPAAIAARQEILFRDINDEWVQIAALTSSSLNSDQLLKSLIARFNITSNDSYLSVIQRLCEIKASDGSDHDQINSFLTRAVSQKSPYSSSLNEAILSGLSRGLKRNKNKNEIIEKQAPVLISSFFSHKSALIREYTLQLLASSDSIGGNIVSDNVDMAIGYASDKTKPGNYRAHMLSFLGLSDVGKHFDLLKEVVGSERNAEVQRAAIKLLVSTKDIGAAEFLIKSWESIPQENRDAALDIFYTDKSHGYLLLDALESGVVERVSLGWPKTHALLRGFHDKDFQSRAIRILKVSEDAGNISDLYKAIERLKGVESQGLEVFKRNCAVCHQVRGELGISYGPDLGTVHNWSAKDLLANIVNPGQSIAQGFDVWEIQLHNGNTMQGMIKSETSNTIEFVLGPQVTQLINRQDIKSIRSLHTSQMPGFSGVLQEQELADLIAFLRNGTLENTVK